MANYEDDDFDDIYGDDTKTEVKPTEQATPAAAAPAAEPAAAPAAPAPAPAAAAPADPRLALVSGGAAPAPAATSEPAAAPAPASAPEATAPAQDPSAATGAAPAPVNPMAGGFPAGFDPAKFSQSLAQFQQFAQASGQGSGTGEFSTSDGFHAGKIFIPAKDEGKMFIGGLNWETTEESMRNYFSQFGEVTECTIMRDNATGRSRGFGFLTFRDAKVVGIVLQKEHFLDGKIIDPKRAIPREEQDKTAKIFVGGVGNDVTEQDFKTFFEQYGTVIDAQLMMDKDTGRPRGFGFVTFDSEDAVDTIVRSKFLDLKGKPIEVKRAEPRARDNRDDGRNGRGGFVQQQSGGMYNGMDPAAMSQYYQQWQACMAQMQQMMANGGDASQMAGGMNPMMMYQQMMQGQAGMPSGAPQSQPQSYSQSQSHENTIGETEDDRSRYRDRDPRRRGNDDRRRSRSPDGPRDRRRRPVGGRNYRDRERDRGYYRG